MKVSINKILFVLSNFLFFLTIFFDYYNILIQQPLNSILRSNLYSYILLFLFLFFLNFYFLKNLGNKNYVFNVLVYFLILSSGFFLHKFPIIDELILFTFSFTIIVFGKINFKTNIILILLIILFIQSLIGLFFDLKSFRYIIIFSSLIIVYSYFTDFKKFIVNQDQKNILINLFYWSFIVSFFSQFIFWIFKFYFLGGKENGLIFWGNLQPSMASSAAGHLEIPGIVAVFVFVYYSINSKFFLRCLLILISLILMWRLADSRASLLLFLICIFFYLFTRINLKKIFIIFLFVALSQFSFIADKTEIISKTIARSFDSKEYAAAGGALDGNRKIFALAPLNNINLFTFFGSGTYSYYEFGRRDSIKYLANLYNPYYEEKTGLGGSPIRAPSMGTVIAEHGLLLIFIFFLIYLKFLFSNFQLKKYDSIYLSLSLLICVIPFSYFGTLGDSVFLYLLLMPFFYKNLYYSKY